MLVLAISEIQLLVPLQNMRSDIQFFRLRLDGVYIILFQKISLNTGAVGRKNN